MNIELPSQPSGLMSHAQLLRLANHRGGPHVSIYLPLERAGPATRENLIRLKNLVSKAEEDLAEAGMRPTEAHDLLEPARALQDDSEFWQHHWDGISLHIAPGLFLQHRLPLRFPELAIVSERFHLRPLLDLFSDDAYFYLLALSMNDVRVFRCGRYSEQELSVVDMPRSMADALWADDPERQQQFRNQPVAQASGKQGEFGVFHGSGDTLEDETKERLLRYFRQVDQSLHHLLRNESVPLVVVAVDYLHPIYSQANSYRHLLTAGVMGNPESVQPDELRLKAWQLVEPEIRQARQEAMGRFESLQGTGRSSAQIDEVAREAARGRVDTLFIARDGAVWGRTSAAGESLELHDRREAGDEDLVDFAAIQTLTQGGHLYVLEQDEMPVRDPAAAIFRY
jgi:hypothetical protein